MQSLKLCTLATLMLTAAASANAVRHEEKRQAGCNRGDNVVRALSAQSSEAASLCPSLIFFQATVTLTVPAAGVTPTPVITTTTFTQTRSVYPGGRTLEELRFPTGVASFPASRVSSACSCFLGTTATVTTSVSSPTIVRISPQSLQSTLPLVPFSYSLTHLILKTRTTVTTVLATLTGPCATNTPYVGAYSAEPVINNRQRLNTDFISLSNAYQCCNSCLDNPLCVAYFNVPGVSCSTLTTDPNNSGACDPFFSTSRVFVSPARFANNLGGKGPCGSSADITVVRT